MLSARLTQRVINYVDSFLKKILSDNIFTMKGKHRHQIMLSSLMLPSCGAFPFADGKFTMSILSFPGSVFNHYENFWTQYMHTGLNSGIFLSCHTDHDGLPHQTMLRVCHLYARGVLHDILFYFTNKELFPHQEKLIVKCLLRTDETHYAFKYDHVL